MYRGLQFGVTEKSSGIGSVGKKGARNEGERSLLVLIPTEFMVKYTPPPDEEPPDPPEHPPSTPRMIEPYNGMNGFLTLNSFLVCLSKA